MYIKTMDLKVLAFKIYPNGPRATRLRPTKKLIYIFISPNIGRKSTQNKADKMTHTHTHTRLIITEIHNTN